MYFLSPSISPFISVYIIYFNFLFYKFVLYKLYFLFATMKLLLKTIEFNSFYNLYINKS